MAGFHMNSISLISDGDHIVLTTICAEYCLCAECLCSMTHYNITMGHDVAKDTPLWHHSGS